MGAGELRSVGGLEGGLARAGVLLWDARSCHLLLLRRVIGLWSSSSRALLLLLLLFIIRCSDVSVRWVVMLWLWMWGDGMGI